ncbi:PIG-L family deacetylase [Oleiharenicola lentus]|uniref:PIG-L family deacetylase n=1 Tax=Oleiharenicola lentus TaxID=2508720 RepID=A0A4Q1C3I2_9BACT|nr:PIG-L family deacetylase [Oleiharenicola lentus]RXK52892.1 PIG-L family deacetylase [Oleiharenicola lentus]
MLFTPPRVGYAVLVFGLGLVTAAVAQRPRFNPQGDYAYDLAATATAMVNVDLKPDGFAWPAEARPGDTVFLEINVAVEGGEVPEITAARGGVSVRQAFEIGARGRRFLDLSPLRAAAEDTVVLSGRSVAWQTGKARLFFHRNAPLAGRRVLVLAPHPDDAEIAAFGLYRQTGADVITVTAGDAGGENFGTLFPEPAEHFRIKGWIRTWDSISVPFYGGVLPGKARNLGYYDGVLRQMQAAPATVVPPLRAKLDEPGYYRSFNMDSGLRARPFKGTWQALVDDLVWELKRVNPEVIAAPHPLLDAHPDHQFTTIALIEALTKWKGRCELLLYTNHALENEAWPLGDRAAMSGLPPTSRPELFFSGLRSLPLSPLDQKLKLVALEDMHDLRAFDLRDGTPPVTEEVRASWKHHDYYRRGPRPNELFFVLTREDAMRLREAFLARR